MTPISHLFMRTAISTSRYGFVQNSFTIFSIGVDLTQTIAINEFSNVTLPKFAGSLASRNTDNFHILKLSSSG